jgi:hypothetical protein
VVEPKQSITTSAADATANDAPAFARDARAFAAFKEERNRIAIIILPPPTRSRSAICRRCDDGHTVREE